MNGRGRSLSDKEKNRDLIVGTADSDSPTVDATAVSGRSKRARSTSEPEPTIKQNLVQIVVHETMSTEESSEDSDISTRTVSGAASSVQPSPLHSPQRLKRPHKFSARSKLRHGAQQEQDYADSCSTAAPASHSSSGSPCDVNGSTSNVESSTQNGLLSQSECTVGADTSSSHSQTYTVEPRSHLATSFMPYGRTSSNRESVMLLNSDGFFTDHDLSELGDSTSAPGGRRTSDMNDTIYRRYDVHAVAVALTLRTTAVLQFVDTTELLDCAFQAEDAATVAPYLTLLSHQFNQLSNLVAQEIVYPAASKVVYYSAYVSRYISVFYPSISVSINLIIHPSYYPSISLSIEVRLLLSIFFSVEHCACQY